MKDRQGKAPVVPQVIGTTGGINSERSAGAEIVRKLFLAGLTVIDSFNPVVMCFVAGFEKVFLFMKQHHLNPLVKVIFGLAVCFFGGFFTLLITAIEVVRLTTWDTMKANIMEIYKNYCVAREANLKDNMVDLNENGIPDVSEIDKNELFSRKLWLFCNSVDPIGLQQALRELSFSCFAVLSSLSGRFTISISCGCSIADFLRKHMQVRDTIAELLPPQQKKLAGTICNIFFYSLGVFFALLFEQYIMTARSAARGAQLFMEHLILLGKESDLIEKDVTPDSREAEVMIFGLAFLGFVWQVSQNFLLPFPLNILLFPLTMTEWILGLLIRYFSYAQFR